MTLSETRRPREITVPGRDLEQKLFEIESAGGFVDIMTCVGQSSYKLHCQWPGKVTEELT
jgi:hypothetical protein